MRLGWRGSGRLHRGEGVDALLSTRAASRWSRLTGRAGGRKGRRGMLLADSGVSGPHGHRITSTRERHRRKWRGLFPVTMADDIDREGRTLSRDSTADHCDPQDALVIYYDTEAEPNHLFRLGVKCLGRCTDGIPASARLKDPIDGILHVSGSGPFDTSRMYSSMIPYCSFWLQPTINRGG